MSPRGREIEVDKVKLEGGIEIPIRLDKESGKFYAHFSKSYETADGHHSEGQSWDGKDLSALKDEIKTWFRQQKLFKWEPIIIIEEPHGYGHHGRMVLGKTLERGFRAPKLKGKGYEWRQWGHQKPNLEGPSGFVYDTDVEVLGPGGYTHEPSEYHGYKPVILPYTPERWSGLMNLIEMEKALLERFDKIVSGGQEKIDAILKSVQTQGLIGFERGGK